MISGLRNLKVDSAASKSIVYFDGSCPLCSAEIGYYRRKDVFGALSFVDVSESDAVLLNGLTQQEAMQRLHVHTGDGLHLSGAAAFVSIWARLPTWRWVARAAALPGATATLEFGYRMFLPVRPLISRLWRKPRLRM
jgi:predicted DCC family thiol-disulfide oxidoreductase YuxK